MIIRDSRARSVSLPISTAVSEQQHNVRSLHQDSIAGFLRGTANQPQGLVVLRESHNMQLRKI
jgi:hypothetical protein